MGSVEENRQHVVTVVNLSLCQSLVRCTLKNKVIPMCRYASQATQKRTGMNTGCDLTFLHCLVLMFCDLISHFFQA